MNARSFNGPRTLISKSLRYIHSGRNASGFPIPAAVPGNSYFFRLLLDGKKRWFYRPLSGDMHICKTGMCMPTLFRQPEGTVNCGKSIPSIHKIFFLPGEEFPHHMERSQKSILLPVYFHWRNVLSG
ncbi:hypothetical protein [Akkermansia sp.]|uniref:hypothetical protein n=1 Tax=Akkermansia sp. TaxID=1872421 RepID=UPI0025BB9A3D|nr:hypothetical protein [Akkermansia sp.]MCC8149416.1 hypothetical protein [Akkermansia sp.]